MNYQDEEFKDLSRIFFKEKEDPTFGIENIDKNKFDFSIQSLVYINEYLNEIRTSPQIKKVWNKIVLRCGAYLGEVIKNNMKNIQLHWIDYKNALELNKDTFKAYGHSISTAALLYGGGRKFIFPLAKIEKYLNEGSEHNIHHFAEKIIAEFDNKEPEAEMLDVDKSIDL